jgi:hypothetical protein
MWLETKKARNFNAVVWVLGEVNGYVVRRIIVCTVQLQGFSRSSNRFSVAASRLPHSQSMRQSDQKPTRSTACSFFEGNARARPIPSQPRSRPAPVEGAPRALHELGSNSGSTRLRACLTRSSSHTVVSRSIILSKTFVRVLDPVCRAGSHTRLKIM